MTDGGKARPGSAVMSARGADTTADTCRRPDREDATVLQGA
ncbi:MAG TPA: hypothetical protein VF109_09415 [Mycobacteriales bacterium]